MPNPVVHFEIPADDTERAMEFFKKTFEWEFNKFDMPANSSTGGEPYYGVMTSPMDENNMPLNPGEINGGLMKRANPMHMLSNYIQVESIEDSLKDVDANGGKVVMPKTEIAPGMGFIAMFLDTEKNPWGLHEMSPEMKAQSKN